VQFESSRKRIDGASGEKPIENLPRTQPDPQRIKVTV
jgi:hypothetical protein